MWLPLKFHSFAHCCGHLTSAPNEWGELTSRLIKIQTNDVQLILFYKLCIWLETKHNICKQFHFKTISSTLLSSRVKSCHCPTLWWVGWLPLITQLESFTCTNSCTCFQVTLKSLKTLLLKTILHVSIFQDNHHQGFFHSLPRWAASIHYLKCLKYL